MGRKIKRKSKKEWEGMNNGMKERKRRFLMEEIHILIRERDLAMPSWEIKAVKTQRKNTLPQPLQ